MTINQAVQIYIIIKKANENKMYKNKNKNKKVISFALRSNFYVF